MQIDQDEFVITELEFDNTEFNQIENDSPIPEQVAVNKEPSITKDGFNWGKFSFILGLIAVVLLGIFLLRN